MESQLTTQERTLIVITGAILVVFVGLFSIVTRQTDVSTGPNAAKIDYKMARPDGEFSGYDLNGREIEYQYDGIAQRQPMVDSKARINANPQSKNATNGKIKGTVASKAKTQSQAKSAVRPNGTLQNPASRSRVTELTAQKSAGSNEAAYSNANGQGFSANIDNNQNSNQNTEETNVDANKKPKKSFSEWRAQIFESAQRASVASFLEAYKKSEVTAQEVQAMAQDLLDQNNEALKGLGLYILRSTPSLASLSQLVHIEAQIPQNLKSYYDQTLLSYLQSNQVAYLNQALMTKDKVLIKKSLNILGLNLQKISQGQVIDLVDPRYRRDGQVSSQFSMASYKSLLPALQSLASSNDQEISGMAQQVSGIIQSSAVVASF